MKKILGVAKKLRKSGATMRLSLSQTAKKLAPAKVYMTI